MFESLHDWVTGQLGLSGDLAVAAETVVSVLLLLGAAWLADRVLRRVLLGWINRLARRSKASWDDVLVEKRVARMASHLLPALVVYQLLPLAVPEEAGPVADVLGTATVLYTIVVGAATLMALIAAGREIYRRRQGESRIPTGGVVQLLNLVVVCFAVVLIVSTLIGRSPLYVVSGLGALTAVLIIVFRDPLLGFMAGLHLTTNDMVRVGDWIEMPKFGANGTVTDITLTTVKVQNWDKTVSSVPTYSLISDSFKNWRGMAESGGRRIKRAVNIDMTSVRFVDDDLLERLLRIQYIREHLDRRKAELQQYNQEHEVDDSSLVNGRRITNLGSFRAYLEAYLHHHPKIHDDMTFIVRQLDPGPDGIPIEVYVFSNDQEWAHYEGIQADIFDHVLAVIPEFELRVFQHPSGSDLRALGAQLGSSEAPPERR